LRLTDCPPGHYEDDEGIPYIVCKHDGTNYLMVWCDNDEIEDFEVLSGDIILRDCYPSGISFEGEEDEKRK